MILGRRPKQREINRRNNQSEEEKKTVGGNAERTMQTYEKSRKREKNGIED